MLKHETGVDTTREGENWRVVGCKKGKQVFNRVVEPGQVHAAEDEAALKIKGQKQPLGRK